MTKTIFSFLSALLLYSAAAAQSQSDSLKVSGRTPSFADFFVPSKNITDDYFLNELNALRINSYLPQDTSSIWMKTRLQLSGLYNQDNFYSDVKTNILNPLGEQYNAAQSMKLFKSILGAVQTGAAGYLAYKHLKKYGFLKRK